VHVAVLCSSAKPS